MIEGYFEEKGLGLDLNMPPLSAFFEAASSNAKSPVSHGDMMRHGHKAKSDVLPEQLLTAVPGSKLYLGPGCGPMVHH